MRLDLPRQSLSPGSGGGQALGGGPGWMGLVTLGGFCCLACCHEGREGKESNISSPARAVG